MLSKAYVGMAVESVPFKHFFFTVHFGIGHFFFLLCC